MTSNSNLKRNILVCAAWPYANGDLHLGHVAGAYLPADIFARYHRLRGNNVLMVSGSDAHGTPITVKAKEEGVTPFEVVKRYHKRFLEGWQGLGISFDLFTHTHTQNHQELTKKFFLKLRSQGDLLPDTQQQFFDTVEKMFLPDRYVKGTCPFCSNTRARGDQCEACGKTFDSTQLLNPISTISNTAPEIRDTEHFFFQLQKYKEQILSYVSSQPHWRSHVQNFSVAMIEDGLRARPITRDIDWGVEVPEAGWENKVIYVWFDAVIGYLSASLEWAKTSGQESAWEEWWKNPEAKTYYFIGKDNIPFHTVIWPIELMAYDPALNLPFDVPANQFLNIEGEKFSTSRGLAVWLLESLNNFDPDSLRFYLTTIMPETKDSNFSWEEMFTRNNGELVAAWGNLVNRVLSFAHSKFEGKIPVPGVFDEVDQQLHREILVGFDTVASHYEKVELREALKETLRLTREVNKYLDTKAPWTTIKTDPQAAGTSIFVAIRAIDSIKTLFAPILPESSEKINAILGSNEKLFGEVVIAESNAETDHTVLNYKHCKSEILHVDRWKLSELNAGSAFSKPTPLFKLLEKRDSAD